MIIIIPITIKNIEAKDLFVYETDGFITKLASLKKLEELWAQEYAIPLLKRN